VNEPSSHTGMWSSSCCSVATLCALRGELYPCNVVLGLYNNPVTRTSEIFTEGRGQDRSCVDWCQLILLSPIVHVPIGIGSFSCLSSCPFPSFAPHIPLSQSFLGPTRWLDRSSANWDWLIHLRDRSCVDWGQLILLFPIVHVLTGVNSFSCLYCLDRNVSPLRYACLPRGDPYVFLRGLRSIEKNIFCRSVLWELFSLGLKKGVSELEIYCLKALFFEDMKYRIMIAETTRY